MRKDILLITIFIIYISTGYIIVKIVKKMADQSHYAYNNPPYANNLVYNTLKAWQYNLDTIFDKKMQVDQDTIYRKNLHSLISEPCLIIRFSGNMCTPCIDFVFNRIQFCIQDYSENNRVIVVYSNMNPAFTEDYIAKKAYFLKDYLHKELDDLNLPYLFILDSEHRIKSLYIPDPAYPELLDKYLEIMREKIR